MFSDDDRAALRLVFLEHMANTAVAKAEVLRMLETTPPHELDRIYSTLHQVRKVRRKLIAMYRKMSRPDYRGPDDLEPA
jgi:hypothetical protein